MSSRLILVPAHQIDGRLIAAATRYRPANNTRATSLKSKIRNEHDQNKAYTYMLALQDAAEHKRIRRNLNKLVRQAKHEHEKTVSGRYLHRNKSPYNDQVRQAYNKVKNAERALSKHNKVPAFVPQILLSENKIVFPPITKPQFDDGARTQDNTNALQNWYKQLHPLDRGRLIDTFNLRRNVAINLRRNVARRQTQRSAKKQTGSAPGRVAKFGTKSRTRVEA
tara:strand:- start:47 stop:715 length:669 start_codon:yes stop_codon:yes gene_type:complete